MPLYFFRTLLIQVPVNDTQWFQSKITQFIWGTKGPRIARATMYAPKDIVGVPDLKIPRGSTASSTRPTLLLTRLGFHRGPGKFATYNGSRPWGPLETSKGYTEPKALPFTSGVGHKLQKVASAFNAYPSSSSFWQPPVSTGYVTQQIWLVAE